MVEQHQLHHRVEFLGTVPNSEVRHNLTRGHVFLNSSLTESFCIAILEAASCGLLTVSTRVGGIPEVLPSDMILFAQETTPEALAETCIKAIHLIQMEAIDTSGFHGRIRAMYSWENVCLRTQKVYQSVAKLPAPTFIGRLQRVSTLGPFAGLLAILCTTILQLELLLLAYLDPPERIERALDIAVPHGCYGASSEVHPNPGQTRPRPHLRIPLSSNHREWKSKQA
jgi:phosphatidylinositol glycan class A protein